MGTVARQVVGEAIRPRGRGNRVLTGIVVGSHDPREGVVGVFYGVQVVEWRVGGCDQALETEAIACRGGILVSAIANFDGV